VSEIETIIQSMLTFADPEPLHSEVVDSEELIQSAIEAATVHLDENKWQIEVECYALEFVGDRIKLRQALRNLISNAIEAMPDGGRIRVELFVDDDQVCCRVSDNGPGISSEDVRRLTDPFFTTRAEGTGLGLTLVHTIAEVHGGRLHVSPEPSALGGAHFSIRIPFVPSPCR
jgi:two-component system sensor histidine kinase AtoS